MGLTFQLARSISKGLRCHLVAGYMKKRKSEQIVSDTTPRADLQGTAVANSYDPVRVGLLLTQLWARRSICEKWLRVDLSCRGGVGWTSVPSQMKRWSIRSMKDVCKGLLALWHEPMACQSLASLEGPVTSPNCVDDGKTTYSSFETFKACIYTTLMVKRI